MNKRTVITFESLYEVLHRERNKDDLQVLDENFLNNLLKYLFDKKKMIDSVISKKDVFSSSEKEELVIQFNNTKKIIKELYDIRENKIMRIALNKARTGSNLVDTSALLNVEGELFENLVDILFKSRNKVLHNLLELKHVDKSVDNNESDGVSELKELIKIRFIEEVEAFVGKELEEYGPYNAGDETELPFQIANILITNKKAVEAN